MGYLNNQVVTIDTILTKKGRELIAKGNGEFKITQFALADDEVNYNLYNPTHPSGSSYYGEAIENMPLLEAFPDETQTMKYKLVTLPRGTAKMPILDLGQSNIILNQTAEKSITPQTLNFLGNNSVYENSGYIFTISDIRLFSTFKGTGMENVSNLSESSNSSNLASKTQAQSLENTTSGLRAQNLPTANLSESNTTIGTNISKTVIGTTLTMKATGINTLFTSNNYLQATLTVIGRDSGARIQIPVRVNNTSISLSN